MQLCFSHFAAIEKEKQVSLHLWDHECLFAWLPCFVFNCNVRPIIFYRIKNMFILKCHYLLNMKVLYFFFFFQHVFFFMLVLVSTCLHCCHTVMPIITCSIFQTELFCSCFFNELCCLFLKAKKFCLSAPWAPHLL